MDAPPQTRRISRKGLLGLCDRLAGVDGRATYHEGQVLLEAEGGETVAILPPFPLDHEASYQRVETGPLVEALERPRVVGLLGVRLGGYGAAVYDDEHLVAGRGGSRFVKNRNKKGGSSSNRYRRRREEQARDLHVRAAALAEEVLMPAAGRLDHLFLAGDRFALEATLNRATPELQALAGRALPATFDVGDLRTSHLADLAREVWSSDVIQTRER
jgi:peptide subunit release factor 1 (eRF1)